MMHDENLDKMPWMSSLEKVGCRRYVLSFFLKTRPSAYIDSSSSLISWGEYSKINLLLMTEKLMGS